MNCIFPLAVILFIALLADNPIVWGVWLVAFVAINVAHWRFSK